jgi:IrrE N-terminal-like domain
MLDYLKFIHLFDRGNPPMTKPDDSSLDPSQRRAVEERARKLLDRASGWNRFPTPTPDILEAAKLKVATYSAFDPRQILAYLQKKGADAAVHVKSAISKVLGICDSEDHVIHIDHTVGLSKQNFLKLHETGHHELPAHRSLFRLFQDCEKTLDPEVSELFEREANNFARFTLFQGDTYAKMAADCAFEIKTPIKLATKFGASVYASSREFARTNARACAVYILEPAEFVDGLGFRAAVRRIEVSPTFRHQFGRPRDTVITPDHPLGRVVPIGRKMSRPTALSHADRNGTPYECVAEAFDTTHNIIILLYPVRALTRTTIIVPGNFLTPSGNSFLPTARG